MQVNNKLNTKAKKVAKDLIYLKILFRYLKDLLERKKIIVKITDICRDQQILGLSRCFGNFQSIFWEEMVSIVTFTTVLQNKV
jgi:hypothetical protein